MQFYKVQGFIQTEAVAEEKEEFNRRMERRAAMKIAVKTEEFNQNHGKMSYLCISEICEGLVTVCGITKEISGFTDLAHEFFAYLDMQITDMKCEEVTMQHYQGMLSTASRNAYIEDDDAVLEMFGIDIFNSRYARGMDFGENLIDIQPKECLENTCRKYLATGSLLPEIERIYKRKTAPKTGGHPVQYILETDDTDIRRELYQTLLSALYEKGRVKNRRYCYVNLGHGSDYSRSMFDALYKSCEGGVMVIRFNPTSPDDESEFASSDRDIIRSIANRIQRYRNKALTILCLPRECEKIKKLFFESLGNICFVELKEDFAKGDAAKDYLKMLAKEAKVRPDKKLYASLEEDKGYLSNDLRDMFEEWYDEKLHTSIYPEYKDAKKVKKEIQKATPKGSAYDTLCEMIGLTSAKEVINNALDFYKAQKLFKDKGMQEDRPAMHMVFTGNPGSAKTTVARLFAEIMRDNELLSRGHIVECGRSDLVGKYVGWTAVQVKNKFREAQGGVLFIDEAYSLVDDRDGMFGDEAINTIVQEMENHREDVVCIFAGYPDKMEGFLNKNPGLRSRIAFHVPFDDYTPDELCDITKLIAKGKGLTIEPSAIDKLRGIYADAIKTPDFGNGRAARNIVEKARMAQASRLVKVDFDKVTKDDIITIKAEDIVIPENKAKPAKSIGFCA